jgi:Na+-transporting methylmalonyl-CoA/oxaloacetate decarboxylase gamma subunit
MKNKGFTLVELVIGVVLVILVFLVITMITLVGIGIFNSQEDTDITIEQPIQQEVQKEKKL